MASSALTVTSPESLWWRPEIGYGEKSVSLWAADLGPVIYQHFVSRQSSQVVSHLPSDTFLRRLWNTKVKRKII